MASIVGIGLIAVIGLIEVIGFIAVIGLIVVIGLIEVIDDFVPRCWQRIGKNAVRENGAASWSKDCLR